MSADWAGVSQFPRCFASRSAPQRAIAKQDRPFLESLIDISIIEHVCQNENSIHCPRRRFRSCSLADEDLHGYGIMRQVAEQTERRMRLGPGTLYSSIQTLLEAKLIEELDQREDATLGQEWRRYYRLTSGGRKLARSEAERLADLLRVTRAQKILRGDYV
jgi:DNA-binding PadR family transcriptional regulator